MIIMAVNPHLKSINMLSIPRDTRTEIVGHGTVDKINHAYAFWGVDMSIKTVEKFLNIPIDYYVKINMEGFEDIVDVLDGVTAYNNLAFSAGSEYFKEGELSLDGQQALAFSRMRPDDPEGDFGRQKRQREIIESILKKGSSITSLWNYSPILKAISKNIKTNFSLDEMIGIQSKYKDFRKNIQEYRINGKGRMIANQQGNKIWYYIVSDDERQKLSNILREHLKLRQETVTAQY
ncbi:LCP family protein [Peribacillus loiseleuriae]|uniref:LCP family glycopolymer transferase n=1 Tax=Peribacillus loiseleuriae TaxID=1679170 RepID=UPI003D07975C